MDIAWGNHDIHWMGAAKGSLICVANAVRLAIRYNNFDLLEYSYGIKPDFSKLTNPKIWIDAYGQVFYSMSVAFGIMITYSSYLPDDSDIANNAFMTGFADTSFSLFAGITVFSIIGYMAHSQGKAVADVAGSGGIGLAFIVFPEAIKA